MTSIDYQKMVNLREKFQNGQKHIHFLGSQFEEWIKSEKILEKKSKFSESQICHAIQEYEAEKANPTSATQFFQTEPAPFPSPLRCGISGGRCTPRFAKSARPAFRPKQTSHPWTNTPSHPTYRKFEQKN